MPNPIDLTGRTFGGLLVIALLPERGNRGQRIWECLCECGARSSVTVINLTSGNTTSCGCRKNQATRERETIHGDTGTPEYGSYSRMISRCYHEKNKAYRHYGGRGITVCARWLDSYVWFIVDVGPKPSPAYSIERIDNNGNYEPGNVKWATATEQNNNKRSNRMISVNGVSLTAAGWSRVTGQTEVAIYKRILRGWSPERAVQA